jgi:spermidine synthase
VSGPALIALFFASGATSLVYETIWARELHLVFGTSALAISTTLAAFMGGLALGAFAAARLSHRIAHPLRVYAGLEAAIGVYAVLFPTLLERATPLYLGLARVTDGAPTIVGTFQFLLMFALLLPPTICMGATLPIAVGAMRHRTGCSGTGVGRLYGANTIGAVAGTAIAGFVMLPSFGLTTTTWIAVIGNIAVALAALARPHCPGTTAHATPPRPRRRTEPRDTIAGTCRRHAPPPPPRRDLPRSVSSWSSPRSRARPA